LCGQAKHFPLCDAGTGKGWLYRSEIKSKIWPIAGLPYIHEAYFIFNRFKFEAINWNLRFIKQFTQQKALYHRSNTGL
jgi:hypothetical protein